MADNVLEIILKAEVDNATKAIEDFAKTVGVEVKGAVSVYEAFNKKIKEIETKLKASKSPEEVAKLTLELKKTQDAFGSIKAGNFSTKLTEVSKNSNSASFAVLNLGRITQDASFGFIGIANNIEPFIQSITELKESTAEGTSATKAFFSALAGPAGIGVLIGAVSLLDAYSNAYGIFAGRAKEAKKAQADFNDELNKAKAPALEAGFQLQQFVKIASNAALPLAQRKKAIEEGNKILGDYGTKLTLANVASIAITEQTKLFTQALVQQAVAAKLAGKVADNIIAQSEAIRKYTEAVNSAPKKPIIAQSANVDVRAQLRFLEGQDKIRAASENYKKVTEDLKNTTNLANKTTAESVALFAELGKEVKDVADATNAAALSADQLQKAQLEVNQALENFPLNIDKITGISEGYLNLVDALKLVRAEEEARLITAQRQAALDQARAIIGTKIIPLATTAPAKLLQNLPTITTATDKKSQDELANLTAINNKVADIKNGFATLAPIVDAAFNALSGGENAVEGLKQAVKSLIIQLLKAAALAAIISIATGGAAGGGTSFLTAFKGILGFKAQGGTVNSGSPYIVGENGPELFVPTGSGNIVSNGRFGNAGGGGGVLTARVSGGDLLFILNQAGNNRSVNFG